MSTDTEDDVEETYLALLGLAQHFSTAPYNNYFLSLKCLKSCLNLPVEPERYYGIYLMIGKILYVIYNDCEISRGYFEKAWYSSDCEIKYPAGIFLSRINVTEKEFDEAERILIQCANSTCNNFTWFTIFTLELTNLYLYQKKNLKVAITCLKRALDKLKASPQHAFYIYLNLAIINLLNNESTDFERYSDSANSCLKRFAVSENYSTTAKNSAINLLNDMIVKESNTIYLLIIQIISHLIQGKGKSIKIHLKKLQQVLQTFMNRTPEEIATQSIVWLPKDFIILISYLCLIVHAIQVGYMERAYKYIEKGITQISALKSDLVNLNDRHHKLDFRHNAVNPWSLISVLELAFTEFSIVSHLVTGKYLDALKEIDTSFMRITNSFNSHLISLRNNTNPQNQIEKSFIDIRLHTFLGLYSLATKEYEKCQTHFLLVKQRCHAIIANSGQADKNHYNKNLNSEFEQHNELLQQSEENNNLLDIWFFYAAKRYTAFANFNLLLMLLHLSRRKNLANITSNINSKSKIETEITNLIETICLDMGVNTMLLPISSFNNVSENTLLIKDNSTNNAQNTADIAIFKTNDSSTHQSTDLISTYIFKTGTSFILSLWNFCCKRDFNESKKYLREALKMSNAEDINRMTAFSLLLLGQIFIHSQNYQDCLTMLSPGCQLSVKILDPCSQIWASVLYKRLYQATGNESQYQESLQLSTRLSETFAKEYQQAIISEEHKRLIALL